MLYLKCFFTTQNAKIVACILLFRKSRYKRNLKRASKYGFFPDLGGKNGEILNMRMQVRLDSPFARPGSAPIWSGKKGEFRDWTNSHATSDFSSFTLCYYCLKPILDFFKMFIGSRDHCE